MQVLILLADQISYDNLLKEKGKQETPNFYTSTTIRNHKTPYVTFPKFVFEKRNPNNFTPHIWIC